MSQNSDKKGRRHRDIADDLGARAWIVQRWPTLSSVLDFAGIQQRQAEMLAPKLPAHLPVEVQHRVNKETATQSLDQTM